MVMARSHLIPFPPLIVDSYHVAVALRERQGDAMRYVAQLCIYTAGLVT